MAQIKKTIQVKPSSTAQTVEVIVDVPDPVITVNVTGGTPIVEIPTTPTPPAQPTIQPPKITRTTIEDWTNGGRALGGRITNTTKFGIPGILFDVAKTDPLVADGRRSEVLTAGHQTIAEKWIKKKVSVPSTWKTEPNDLLNVVMFQYHDDWDEAAQYGTKEFHSPFDVVIVQDKWVAHVRSGTTSEVEKVFTLGKVLKDKLQTFVCHLKFNTDGVSKGICQIWLDGVLVLDLSGSAAIPMGYKIGTQQFPRHLPYEKQGLYAWFYNDDSQAGYAINPSYQVWFGPSQEWQQSQMPSGILL